MAMFRHEAFCKRNMTKCEICRAVILTAQAEQHHHCEFCKLLVDPDNHQHCSVCQKCMSTRKMAAHGHCNVCSKEVHPQELQKHAQMYHQNSISCDCGLLFDLEALKIHKETTCDLLLVQCTHCDTQVMKKNRLGHEKRCGAETVACEICGIRHLRKFKVEHQFAHN
jgi:hypothetical protein